MNIDVTKLRNGIEMLELCLKAGIQPEAWAPFAEGSNNIFHNPVLSRIVEAHGKTVGQVILRWNIQRGVVVIPKSVHKERVVENFNIRDFSLTTDEMNEIGTLDTARPLIFDYDNPEEVRRIYGIPCPE